jgi:hypothetical protein
MARQFQQRFTQGEFDPKMLARTDIDQYLGGAEKMTNVIALQQGGFKRRGGLEHIDEMLRQLTFVASPTISAPNGGATGNANDRVYSTEFLTTNNIGTTNPYVVVQYDLGSAQTIGVVHLVGLALTVSGTSSEFFVQVSTDNATWVNAGSALTLTTTVKNYSRRVEGSYRYVRLARIGAADLSTNKVTLRDMNVYTQGANSDIRLVSFEFNSEQSYMLAVTDKNIAVYFDGAFQVDIPAPNITNAMLDKLNWAQSADTLLLFHEDMPTQIVQRQGANDFWSISDLTFTNIPFYAFNEVVQTGASLSLGTLTPSATTGTITLTISIGSFPSGIENQYIEGNGGRARVLSTVSSTVVNAFVEVPFYGTTAIAAADWEYLSGYEEAWSSTRGYPICGTFHSGRLWIGGSRSRPTTLWGSRAGLFYDFSLGTALDDEGIEATIDTDQLNRIVNLYSGRNLMIFTTGAEFIIPVAAGEPITPKNISTLRQSRIGSFDGFRVAENEGGVFYLQAGGRSVQEFIYFDTQQAYGNNLVSLLSGHLVVEPTDFCLRRATSLDEGALLAITRADGGATIATIRRDQLITAFTNHTTQGSFTACGADYNDLYFAVNRGGKLYLERLNDDAFLDASVLYTAGLPADTFTGLEHLNGLECRVIADGSVLPRVTPSGGSATIEREAEESCEIGLWFQPLVKDLPVVFNFANVGTTMGRYMNIEEIVLRLFETVSIKVNGAPVAFRGFGVAGGNSPLDAPPPEFSGIKRIQGFRGWDYTGQVTITQDEPAKMTVLGYMKRIKFDG